jgi:hypothetical protein
MTLPLDNTSRLLVKSRCAVPNVPAKCRAGWQARRVVPVHILLVQSRATSHLPKITSCGRYGSGRSLKTSAMAACPACFPFTPPPLLGRSTITGYRSSSTWSYRDTSHTLVAVVCTPADITNKKLVRCVGARSNLKLTVAFREGLQADLAFPEGSGFAGIQKLLPVEAAEKLDQFCDHPVHPV